MSFDTDPALYDFAVAPDICNLCFAIDKTPETFFLGLTGILRGDLWTGADPPPPNGTWEITASGVCGWSLSETLYEFNYDTNILFSQLNIFKGAVTFFFSQLFAVACVRQFSNALAVPAGNKYYGGDAQILSPLDSGSDNNIELMGLLNILPESLTFCKPSASTPPVIVNRYSRGSDATNIHIKFDLT